MKILIAPDSFKESLTSEEVCQAMVKGIRNILPDSKIITLPLSDGGEGMVNAIINSSGGTLINTFAYDPLLRNIKTLFGVLADKETAVIEVATIIGLSLLNANERNPMKTSSFGVGQLIIQALDLGYRKIILGLGGTATNDGGVGMLKALGIKFLDKSDNPISDGGGALNNLVKIDATGIDQRLKETEFIIACDVNNTLIGTTGASYVYGPQKGASPEMVITLDTNLKHYATILKRDLNIDICDVPGSGAAGGLGGACIGFFKANLQLGFSVISNLINLEKHIEDADIILTGEGKLDRQTLFGKVILGVGTLGKKHNVPVVVFTAAIQQGAELLYDHGITSIVSICQEPISKSESMNQASRLLENAVERTFRLLSTKII
jgi:glycerate kinase